MTPKICLTISGARPSDGSSSSRRRGPAHQCPRNRQHLLLAARQRTAALPLPLLQDREQPEDAGEVLVEAGGVGGSRPDLQVFEHGHAREDSPSFRHLGDPAPHDLECFEPGDVAPVEQNPAARRPRPAANRHQQGRFAGAVGADQSHDLAGADLEIDPLQRFDIAVEGVNPGDREHHGCLPLRPWGRRGREVGERRVRISGAAHLTLPRCATGPSLSPLSGRRGAASVDLIFARDRP